MISSRTPALVFLSALLTGAHPPQQQPSSFREQQLAHARVKTAAQDKDDAEPLSLFAEKRLPYQSRRILLRAFKREAILEVGYPTRTHKSSRY
jgi:hypothetical protein